MSSILSEPIHEMDELRMREVLHALGADGVDLHQEALCPALAMEEAVLQHGGLPVRGDDGVRIMGISPREGERA